MTAIETDKLTKKYKSLTAVDSLTLNVEKGSLYSLLGVNGAGKTTTVKLLSCLCRPDGGDAQILGHSIRRDPFAVKEIIGLSPQETAVARNLTVNENLMLFAGIHGLDRQASKERTAAMTADFGLSEVGNKKAKLLSGGMQRRLSIASALISRPQVLFLDEPTLGLDVLARRELWKIISELKGEITVILTTHYMEEAEALSDRVGIMSRGRLVAEGSPKEIIERSGCGSFEDAFIHFAAGEEENR